ncbi:MAG TPA: hypothetical protein VHE35_02305 [Kofleriaceae bacterium]|nr:hypothetical protein [Kofleriaceae bacterium]
MLSIRVETDIEVGEPDEDAGLVTWWDVSITWAAPDGEGAPTSIGKVRAATIHVGAALNAGVAMADVLDADSAELEALYDVFFDGNVLREEFESGVGDGLLYIADIEMPDVWRQRGADLAVVHQLGDAIGMGCGLIILPPDASAQEARWARLGFEATSEAGYLYREQSVVSPRVVAAADDCFEVIPGRQPPHDDD